jgi:hypothetical protein
MRRFSLLSARALVEMAQRHILCDCPAGTASDIAFVAHRATGPRTLSARTGTEGFSPEMDGGPIESVMAVELGSREWSDET